MSAEPFPPRLSMDEYARWITSNLSQTENREQHILQKQIQEPPLAEPFRYIDPPGSPHKVAESSAPWADKS